MGFFRDLFGPRLPCALCHLGAQQWPSAHSGSADWKLKGPGGEVALLVCVSCRQFLVETGLLHKHPMSALAQLMSLGRARRPDPRDFLANDSWRYIWVELLSSAGKYTPDPTQLAATMGVFANQFYADALEELPGDEEADDDDATDPFAAAVVEASGLLEPMITMRALDVDPATVRRCALAMVIGFCRSQLSAPTTNVQMLFLGGHQEFESQWRAWKVDGGDPVSVLQSTFAEDTDASS